MEGVTQLSLQLDAEGHLLAMPSPGWESCAALLRIQQNIVFDLDQDWFYFYIIYQAYSRVKLEKY